MGPEDDTADAERAEARRHEEIQMRRDDAATALAEIEKFTRAVERYTRHLSEGDLYDVDYADTGAPRIVADAIAAIRLNVAAMRSVVPAVDQVWVEERRQAELDRRLGA